MQRLIRKLIKFRDRRCWQKHHTGPALSHKLMIEAAEVGECFEWNQEPSIPQLEEELGDVLILTLFLCEKYQLDPKKIVNQKIKKNKKKYPPNYTNSNWR